MKQQENTPELPFQSVWWSVSLKYRRSEDTYGGFPYDDLPRFENDIFKGLFDWLTPMSAYLRQELSVYRRPEAEERVTVNLPKLQAQASELDISLPPSFQLFMASPELQLEIPSATACYFDLPDRSVKLPLQNAGIVIRFLNDQQEIFLWYLHLNSFGEAGVLISSIMRDQEDLSAFPLAFSRQYPLCGPFI